MKSLIVVLCFIIGCATVVPLTQEQTTKQIVVDLPEMNKIKIYEETLRWIAYTFKSAKAVIEYQSKDEGKIIGNGIYSHSVWMGWRVDIEYSISIDVKDKKARLTIQARGMSRYNGYGQLYTRGGVEDNSASGFNVFELLKNDFALIENSFVAQMKNKTDKKEW